MAVAAVASTGNRTSPPAAAAVREIRYLLGMPRNGTAASGLAWVRKVHDWLLGLQVPNDDIARVRGSADNVRYRAIPSHTRDVARGRLSVTRRVDIGSVGTREIPDKDLSRARARERESERERYQCHELYAAVVAPDKPPSCRHQSQEDCVGSG